MCVEQVSVPLGEQKGLGMVCGERRWRNDEAKEGEERKEK